MTTLPLADAARELDVRPGTLRRWMRQGCPVAARGRRGRGHATLIDPDAVRQWRGSDRHDKLVLTLADALPEVIAQAIAESFRVADGIDKRKLAGIMAATWYVSANAVLDHLRGQCPIVPELTKLPEQIERLAKIARE